MTNLHLVPDCWIRLTCLLGVFAAFRRGTLNCRKVAHSREPCQRTGSQCRASTSIQSPAIPPGQHSLPRSVVEIRCIDLHLERRSSHRGILSRFSRVSAERFKRYTATTGVRDQTTLSKCSASYSGSSERSDDRSTGSKSQYTGCGCWDVPSFSARSPCFESSKRSSSSHAGLCTDNERTTAAASVGQAAIGAAGWKAEPRGPD